MTIQKERNRNQDLHKYKSKQEPIDKLTPNNVYRNRIKQLYNQHSVQTNNIGYI